MLQPSVCEQRQIVVVMSERRDLVTEEYLSSKQSDSAQHAKWRLPKIDLDLFAFSSRIFLKDAMSCKCWIKLPTIAKGMQIVCFNGYTTSWIGAAP